MFGQQRKWTIFSEGDKLTDTDITWQSLTSSWKLSFMRGRFGSNFLGAENYIMNQVMGIVASEADLIDII